MIIFSSSDISESEKIEQIHAILLSQHRSRVSWTVVKLLIIAILGFGYYYYTQPQHAEQRIELITAIHKKFSAFIAPLVSDVLSDVLKNIQNPNQSAASSGAIAPNVTPEMIKAVQDSMQK